MLRNCFRLFAILLVPFALLGCQDNVVQSTSKDQPQVAAQSNNGPPPAAKCDVVVPDDKATIQDGVDAASSGETVCVEPGTYDENVTVNKGVTLRGRTAPQSNNAVVVDGRFAIEPDGDGTTIRRFQITSSETFVGGTFPDPFGVRVKASDVLVENNIIEDLQADLSNGGGSFTLHGVQVFGAEGENVSNVTVRDNVVRGFQSDGVPGEWPKYGGVAAVKIQADVDGATVVGNRITDHHSAGWVWGVVLTGSASAPGHPKDVTVEDNHIEGLNDGSEFDVFSGANSGRDVAPFPGGAFGIDGGAEAGEATVEQNNLLAPNGAESKDQDDTLVAECNWWGDRSGPTDDGNPGGSGTWALERGSATIDYTPWLNAPAPSNACVGGETPGNGPGNSPGGGPGQ